MQIGLKIKRYRKVLAAIIALAMVAAVFFAMPGQARADDSDTATGTGMLVIKEQPKSAEVSYPDGATFHVEVEKPEDVASYEWTYSDGSTTYHLDGMSAATDTLIIPSTMQDDNPAIIQCKITDKQGNTYTTKEATLTVTNKTEDKSVLYVGDYAVEPGETLDLAQTGLGRGTVTFDADGCHITFENFNFDNTTMTFDRTIAPATGLFFVRRNPDQIEYHFTFKGNCVINNTYFNEDYNSGGVTFNSFFACGDSANRPMVIIDGDGKVTFKGGGNQIYSDADIEIAADLKTDVLDKRFCDGIRAGNIFVDEDVHLQMNVNGTALHSEGDIRIYDNAKLIIRSVAPHVGVGPTAKNILYVGGSLYAKNAGINIIGIADPENFLPYGSALATFGGILLAENGNLNLDATKVYIDLSTISANEPFAMNFTGISGGGQTNAISMENGASIDINMNDPEVATATGINMPGIVEVNQGCSIALNVLSAGETTGLEADRILTVNDGLVDSTVTSAGDGATYGIVSGEITINLTENIYYVHSKVDEGGFAMAADTGERGNAPTEYDPSYKAEKIQLLGKADCLEPEKNDISLWGVPGYGDIIVVETIFNTSGDASPATEVLIGQGNSLIWLYCVIAGLIILALIIFFLIRGHRQKQRDAAAEEEETAEAGEAADGEKTAEASETVDVEETAEAGETEETTEEEPRVTKTHTITVDADMCLLCGMCIKECQAGVLAFNWQKVPDYVEGGKEKCLGCGFCETVCPAGALHFEE
ncbi:MAG: 4Fe-4S dicluster domain-containing protein [Lachnospiraceae bacterium]|nr:4Fe-4S dicluster domain-containing protein [Lachnospiraceae bacterium]